MTGGNKMDMPEGLHTRAEVAQFCGKSLTTIKRLEKNGLIAPTLRVQRGKVSVRAYSDDDMQRALEVACAQCPGPKPKPMIIPLRRKPLANEIRAVRKVIAARRPKPKGKR